MLNWTDRSVLCGRFEHACQSPTLGAHAHAHTHQRPARAHGFWVGMGAMWVGVGGHGFVNDI